MIISLRPGRFSKKRMIHSVFPSPRLCFQGPGQDPEADGEHPACHSDDEHRRPAGPGERERRQHLPSPPGTAWESIAPWSRRGALPLRMRCKTVRLRGQIHAGGGPGGRRRHGGCSRHGPGRDREPVRGGWLRGGPLSGQLQLSRARSWSPATRRPSRRAVDKVNERGKRAVLLPVSAPFHSPLMKPAGRRVSKKSWPKSLSRT